MTGGVLAKSSNFSTLDKWNQLKKWTEDRRFMMMTYDYSLMETKIYENCKIRGVRISWSAGDNACLNFFSSLTIKKGFAWEKEMQGHEDKYKDLYWEENSKKYRLILKNPKKSQIIVLYLGDPNELFKIVFYFKYQLHLKKKLSNFAKKVDLAVVWKTRHYFEPMLNRIKMFTKKYQHLSQEEFQKVKAKFKSPKDWGRNENIVETRLDLNTIKESVANNDKQLTFQIIDFQIVGALVIDQTLMKTQGLKPLRGFGPSGMKALIHREKDQLEKIELGKSDLEFENQANDLAIRRDFKRKVTLDRKKRKIQEMKKKKEMKAKNLSSISSNRKNVFSKKYIEDNETTPFRSKSQKTKQIFADDSTESINIIDNKVQIFDFSLVDSEKKEIKKMQKSQEKKTTKKESSSGIRDQNNFTLETGTMQLSHRSLSKNLEDKKKMPIYIGRQFNISKI